MDAQECLLVDQAYIPTAYLIARIIPSLPGVVLSSAISQKFGVRLALFRIGSS